MAEFLKSLAKLIMISVTILGFLALFFKALKSPLVSLIALVILLFVGFIFLIIYYFIKLEERMNSIEQKFIRENELKDIRKDIEALKLELKYKKK